MPKRFVGKVCLVSGAGSGIRQETAISFAREGAKLIAADIDEEGCKQTVSSIEALGGEAIFCKTDISKRADTEAMVQATVKHFGRLDHAVNCAGITRGVSIPTHEYPEDRWYQVIAVNLTGMWYSVKAQLNKNRVNAVCPTAIETPTIMDGRLNLSNNQELREKFTSEQAMMRIGQPKEVADVVLWLSSDESSFITGHAMPVDGGAFAK
ncbi:SDR family NAD(P)-dependent oxidoreductase [Neobacillus drentensis]|uniref:SDR family NAD(P)-dependent oxidoreductase n=1 Tax=Neobacillus drentensis TaxID=220684 RepID=UPI002FFE6B83